MKSVVIFTKPPIPGHVKTRLIPALGAEGAAQLHAAMAEDVVANVKAAGLEARLSVAGDPTHPWVQSLGLPADPQPQGDLGARMEEALGPDTIALGTDSPTLPVEILLQAADPAVSLALGPAFDGGYYLLAWSTPRPALLRDMEWSVDSVAAETLIRAQRRSWEVKTLPFWYDVDTPEVLSLLRQHLRSLPASTAPRTRAVLAKLPS